MSKITLTNLVNLNNPTTAVSAINSNNAVIQAAMDNTLSRDGTSPNTMGASLDMNGNHILNLPAPITTNEPVRLADMTNYVQFQNSVNLAAAVASASASASSASTSAANAATSANGVSIPTVSITSFIPSGQLPAIVAGTSTFDCGPAFNTALAQLDGRPLYIPAGTYPVYTPIRYAGVANPVISIALTSGCKLWGEGSSRSIIKNMVAGIPLSGSSFSTVSGSSSVTAIVPNHGLLVSQPIVFNNASTVGGLAMEGPQRVAAVIDANTIQFNHFNNATSTVTNSGGGIVSVPMMWCYNYNTPNQSRVVFQIGTEFKNLSVISGIGSNNGTCAIRLSAQFQTLFDDVWILGGDDGVQCYAITGDVPINNIVDSTTHILFQRVRFDNNARWGAEIVGGCERISGSVIGHNEVSNVVFEDCLFNNCGYNNNVAFNGGGLKWKGQGIHFTSTAFTTCNNTSIYVWMPSGAAGTPSAFTFNNLVLENSNGYASMHVDALDTMVGQMLEIYDGASYPASYGVYFNQAGNFAIDNINISSSIVRVDPAVTPYTLYSWNSTPSSTVRIYTPSFQEFGAGGQVQTVNITFKT